MNCQEILKWLLACRVVLITMNGLMYHYLSQWSELLHIIVFISDCIVLSSILGYLVCCSLT